MGQGSAAVAWLTGDFLGTGRTQIAQPWDNAMIPQLIRNRVYDTNPDINADQAKSWTVERAALPPGAQGFAVSGDRSNPVYFVFTDTALFIERDGSWIQVLADLTPSQTFGPVFANPYDAHVVYALSDQGVQVSTDAGSTFGPAARLNALLAGSSASQVNQISFNYDNPAAVAVCTDSGQLLFNAGGENWRDLTPLLPTPLVPIRSVAIDCEAIYMATFGRGLQRVVNYSTS